MLASIRLKYACVAQKKEQVKYKNYTKCRGDCCWLKNYPNKGIATIPTLLPQYTTGTCYMYGY